MHAGTAASADASRAAQFAGRTVQKEYLAVVLGPRGQTREALDLLAGGLGL